MLLKGRRIFVSHASEDDQLATSLVDCLARRGLKAFADHHPRTGIIPGRDWLDSISGDIRAAQSVLLLISVAWRQSPWCQAEFRAAKLMKKNIIPIVVGNEKHEDIEPSLQKVFVAGSPPKVTAETVEAIARALPNRSLVSAGVYGGIVTVVTLLTAGVEGTPFGSWDVPSLRGGDFVDLAVDPQNGKSVFAVASDAWGTRGLFASTDCGAHWTALSLPPRFGSPNRLDVTREEILVATDDWVWALNRDTQTWHHLALDGLSSHVLVAKHVPERPHELAYGTLRRGVIFSGGEGLAGYGASDRPGGATIVDRRTGRRRSFDFQMNDIAFGPRGSNRVAIAAANDGVFFSLDAMKTVHKLENYHGHAPLLVSFDNTGDTVLVSAQDGLWAFEFPRVAGARSAVEKVLAIEGEATHVTTLPDGTKLLGSTSGPFRSNPNQPRFDSLPAPIERHVTKIVRCEDRLLAATRAAGVFALSPTTQEWQQVLTSGSNLPAYAGIRFNELELVSAGPYVFRSVNRGHRFDPLLARGAGASAFLFDPPSQPNSSSDSLVYAVSDRSEAARGSYLYTEGQVVAGLGDGRILLKPHGSLEWSEVSTDSSRSRSPVTTLVRSATHPEILLATFVGAKPVWSTDAGRTWTTIPNATGEEALAAFALRDGRFLLAGVKGTLRLLDTSGGVRSVGGTVRQSPITGFAFEHGTQGVLMADLDGRLYTLKPPFLNVLEVGRLPLKRKSQWVDVFCCDADGTTYVAGDSVGIFRSAHPAKTWRPISLRGLTADAKVYAIATGHDRRPAFATDAGYLRPVSSGKFCVSDVSCFAWRASNIRNRLQRITSLMQLRP